MRKSFDGLYGLVRGMGCDPESGYLYLFSNGRRDRMKVLFFDGSGLWVCAKRMQGGRLRWPVAEDGRVQLSREQFALLVGGIDLAQTRERKWFRRPPTVESDKSRESA